MLLLPPCWYCAAGQIPCGRSLFIFKFLNPYGNSKWPIFFFGTLVVGCFNFFFFPIAQLFP
jgi:hypothetical protein